MSRIEEIWRAWRALVRDRRIAAQFAERDLRDMGLTPGDVHRALAWRLRRPRPAPDRPALPAVEPGIYAASVSSR